MLSQREVLRAAALGDWKPVNISQQIFAIWFAIMWGTSSSSWLKWKPFHWVFIRKNTRILRRAVWAMIMLNVIPITYFIEMLKLLGYVGGDRVTWLSVALGVVPGFAVFGFYRIWLALMEGAPTKFYYLCRYQLKADMRDVEPIVPDLHLRPANAIPNLCAGLIYVFLSVVVPVGTALLARLC